MDLRNVPQVALTLCLLIATIDGRHSYTGGGLKMDQALLTFYNHLSEGVDVFYTSDYCYKCLYQPLISVEDNNHNASAVVSTKFTLTMQVESQIGKAVLCRWSQTYEEGGHYAVWINQHLTNGTCRHTVDKSPHNADLPLLVAALLLSLIDLVFVVAPYIYRRPCTTIRLRSVCCQGPQHSVDDAIISNCCPQDLTDFSQTHKPSESPVGSLQQEDKAHAVGSDAENPTQPKQTRLRSLDTFRGFSLTLMVFVNYGGGGYWFFQHAPWNGLTVADLVMPWFVFIIGTSVALAFRSMRRKGVGRPQLLRKLTWRTAVLVLLGFCFMNYSPRDGPLSWSWLRVPGVLQRLGFTYFALSLMQTLWGRREIPATGGRRWKPVRDLAPYWPEWLLVVVLEAAWLGVTFLLPVPGCPTGYLGAGGISDEGLYPNCTGGAAGYVDRWMFGDNMYRYPTCREMYQTTQPFDPEGMLGTINSIVMGFIGMQAGKILIFYRGNNVSILSRFLVWAVILGASAAILCKCTRDGGFIPVNKNLWSLSYVACTGCFSFLLLGGMYFVIDVKGWWGGQPFIYPGMNSILVYVGHSLLGFYFPFSWEMRFQGSHWEWLFQGLWGTSLWVLVAYLLYRKNFFVKI